MKTEAKKLRYVTISSSGPSLLNHRWMFERERKRSHCTNLNKSEESLNAFMFIINQSQFRFVENLLCIRVRSMCWRSFSQ